MSKTIWSPSVEPEAQGEARDKILKLAKGFKPPSFRGKRPVGRWLATYRGDENFTAGAVSFQGDIGLHPTLATLNFIGEPAGLGLDGWLTRESLYLNERIGKTKKRRIHYHYWELLYSVYRRLKDLSLPPWNGSAFVSPAQVGELDWKDLTDVEKAV